MFGIKPVWTTPTPQHICYNLKLQFLRKTWGCRKTHHIFPMAPHVPWHTMASSLTSDPVVTNEALYHLIQVPLDAQVRKQAVYLGSYLRTHFKTCSRRIHVWIWDLPNRMREHLGLMILSKLAETWWLQFLTGGSPTGKFLGSYKKCRIFRTLPSSCDSQRFWTSQDSEPSLSDVRIVTDLFPSLTLSQGPKNIRDGDAFRWD